MICLVYTKYNVTLTFFESNGIILINVFDQKNIYFSKKYLISEIRAVGLSCKHSAVETEYTERQRWPQKPVSFIMCIGTLLLDVFHWGNF